MLRAISILLAVGTLFGMPACSHNATGPPPALSKGRIVVTTSSGRATLDVEIAETQAQRDRGLMGRTSLDPDSGMAFLWSSPTTGTFWMKDTLIPLSVVFWDAAGDVVAVDEMTPCTADPCKTYGAPVAYVGAAEANARWFGENGVQVGDHISLTRTA